MHLNCAIVLQLRQWPFGFVRSTDNSSMQAACLLGLRNPRRLTCIYLRSGLVPAQM